MKIYFYRKYDLGKYLLLSGIGIFVTFLLLGCIFLDDQEMFSYFCWSVAALGVLLALISSKCVSYVMVTEHRLTIKYSWGAIHYHPLTSICTIGNSLRGVKIGVPSGNEHFYLEEPGKFIDELWGFVQDELDAEKPKTQ